MKRILIAGCGGFGRELWTWLGEPDCYFYSDFKESQEHIYGNEILNYEELKKRKDYIDCFYIGIGDPIGKEHVYGKLINDFKLGPPIYKEKLSSKNKIGDGTIICPGVIITTNVTIGKNVILNINCTVGHDVTIGDFSTVSPGAFISGNVSIGKRCYIGTGASIREKIEIGNDSTVGMGSVVIKNVENNTIVIGNPAKEKK